MKFPRVTYAARTLLRTYGDYHLARLKAEPALESLAAEFSRAQERLRERVEAHAAARTASMTAMAARQEADAALTKAVRAFSLALQAVDGNPRTSARYGTYFPGGLSAVVQAPLEKKMSRAGVILALLDEEHDASLLVHAAPLGAALAAFRQAVDARQAARSGEAGAFGAVHAEKFKWLDAYARSYRDLGVRYYRERAKAESFFRSAPRGGTTGKGNGGPSRRKALRVLPR